MRAGGWGPDNQNILFEEMLLYNLFSNIILKEISGELTEKM